MYQPYARWYKGKAQWFYMNEYGLEIGPFSTQSMAMMSIEAATR